jgi:hypothetical protein
MALFFCPPTVFDRGQPTVAILSSSHLLFLCIRATLPVCPPSKSKCRSTQTGAKVKVNQVAKSRRMPPHSFGRLSVNPSKCHPNPWSTTPFYFIYCTKVVLGHLAGLTNNSKQRMNACWQLTSNPKATQHRWTAQDNVILTATHSYFCRNDWISKLLIQNEMVRGVDPFWCRVVPSMMW